MKNSAYIEGGVVLRTQFFEGDTVPEKHVECPLWVVSGCVEKGGVFFRADGTFPTDEEIESVDRTTEEEESLRLLKRIAPDVEAAKDVTGSNAERIKRLEGIVVVLFRIARRALR